MHSRKCHFRMGGDYVSNIIRQIIHKQLRCPVCGFKRLIDADADNVSELVPEGSMIAGFKADYLQKCPQCKNQIGIRKIG